MKKFLWPALLLVILGFTARTAVFSQVPQVVPDFTFYRLNNVPFKKTDMPRNTRSAFMFFDVTCGHCQKSTQALSRSYASFKNTTLYFVSMDDGPSIMNFINKYGKNLAGKANVFLLEDKKKHFVPLFNPVKFPATFIYDAHNRLVFSSAGDEDLPKILRLLSN